MKKFKLRASIRKKIKKWEKLMLYRYQFVEVGCWYKSCSKYTDFDWLKNPFLVLKVLEAIDSTMQEVKILSYKGEIVEDYICYQLKKI